MTNIVTIDAETAAFLQRSVSINVAARSRTGEPVVSRAFGCRVSTDGRRITLFVARDQGAAVIDGVAANGDVAAVFSRPTTHRTIQFKGRNARIGPWREQDRAQLTAYLDSFHSELRQLGYGAPFIDRLLAAVDDELLCIEFTPNAAFEQTPGARAGQALT